MLAKLVQLIRILELCYLLESSGYLPIAISPISNIRISRSLCQSALIGGPSIVYRRYARVNESWIRPNQFGPEAKLAKSIILYDVSK